MQNETARSPDFDALDRTARELRCRLVEMSHRAQTAHLAGALSCVDILTVAYAHVLRIDPRRPQAPDRDRLIFSKGHAISALYAVLAKCGFFPEEDLASYNEEGGDLPEHPSPGCVPGLEWATGSLGHGLGVGLGMALAARLQRRPSRIMVLVGDGECQEGSIWEAVLLAPRLKLNPLLLIVDFNRWQATGRSNEIMAMEPLGEKFEQFGWRAEEVDGHDLRALYAALSDWRSDDPRPRVLVAHTVKGHGVSFMADDNNWHYRSPSEQDVCRARDELLGTLAGKL